MPLKKLSGIFRSSKDSSLDDIDVCGDLGGYVQSSRAAIKDARLLDEIDDNIEMGDARSMNEAFILGSDYTTPERLNTLAITFNIPLDQFALHICLPSEKPCTRSAYLTPILPPARQSLDGWKRMYFHIENLTESWSSIFATRTWRLASEIYKKKVPLGSRDLNVVKRLITTYDPCTTWSDLLDESVLKANGISYMDTELAKAFLKRPAPQRKRTKLLDLDAHEEKELPPPTFQVGHSSSSAKPLLAINTEAFIPPWGITKSDSVMHTPPLATNYVDHCVTPMDKAACQNINAEMFHMEASLALVRNIAYFREAILRANAADKVAVALEHQVAEAEKKLKEAQEGSSHHQHCAMRAEEQVEHLKRALKESERKVLLLTSEVEEAQLNMKMLALGGWRAAVEHALAIYPDLDRESLEEPNAKKRREAKEAKAKLRGKGVDEVSSEEEVCDEEFGDEDG
ncbi:hypothetical protein ACFE04_004338 [Oxalis oulophora]